MGRDINFSIIMPFYNSEKYIEKAILSVVNQTYGNWEFIAVNDGSLDSSLNIVNRYAKGDKRIRVITKDNGGYSTAINFGLDNLSPNSDYFLLLGSDDELSTDLLFKLENELKRNKYDIASFKTICIFENGDKRYDDDTYIEDSVCEDNTNLVDFYKKHSDIPQTFVVRDTSRAYKTSLLGELRYFGKYGVSADGIFSMLFSYKCKSFSCLPIDGYYWHVRKDSVSSSKPNDLKIEDCFSNWSLFFDLVIQNNFGLTGDSKKYINFYINTYLNIATIDNKTIFNRNKMQLRTSKQIINNLVNRFNIELPFKMRYKISHPYIFRFIKMIKRGNK